MAKINKIYRWRFIYVILLIFVIQNHLFSQGRYSIDHGKIKKRRVDIKFVIAKSRNNYKIYLENRKRSKQERLASKELKRKQKKLQDRKTLKRMKESKRISNRLYKYGTPHPWNVRLKHKWIKKFKNRK